jgi:two-component system, OmpR family, response regulator
MTSSLSHIMCVDDEQDILQVAKLSLEVVGGFRVSLCTGSGEAVEIAQRERPDLILLDVMMPDMDGPATLGKLRQEGGDAAATPVIFMTAKARPDEIKSFLALGAIGVISKPFDPMNLSEQIRTLWKAHHEHA